MSEEQEPLRLYELGRGQGTKIQIPRPGFDPLIVEFDHIDGMYSYCTVIGGEDHGEIVHLRNNVKLKRLGDNEYEIIV